MKINDISYTCEKIYKIITREIDKHPVILEEDIRHKDYFSPIRLEIFENHKEVALFKQIFNRFSKKETSFDDFLFQEYLHQFTECISKDLIKKDKVYPISFVYEHLDILDLILIASKNANKVSSETFIQMCDLHVQKSDETQSKKISQYLLDYLEQLSYERKKEFFECLKNSKMQEILKNDYIFKKLRNEIIGAVSKKLKMDLYEKGVLDKECTEERFPSKNQDVQKFEQYCEKIIHYFTIDNAFPEHVKEITFLNKNFETKEMVDIVIPYFFKSKNRHTFIKELHNIFDNKNPKLIDFNEINEQMEQSLNLEEKHKSIVKI